MIEFAHVVVVIVMVIPRAMILPFAVAFVEYGVSFTDCAHLHRLNSKAKKIKFKTFWHRGPPKKVGLDFYDIRIIFLIIMIREMMEMHQKQFSLSLNLVF